MGFDKSLTTQVSSSISGLDSIRERIQLKIDEINYALDDIGLPDCINFGDSSNNTIRTKN